MNKQMIYRKQIEEIEEQLSKENKAYMGRVNGYMVIASIFHRKEEAVTAQLLSIYQDVLDAQKDGLSAEEFLGKDSKQMADELLSYLPPIGFRELANLSVLALSCYLGCQWLMEFAGAGVISLNWLSVICDVLYSLVFPTGVFLALRGLIYQTNPYKIWATYIGYPLAFFLLLGLRFWVIPKEPDLVLTGWGLVLPLSLLGLALLFFKKEKLVRYVFLPTYLCALLVGTITMTTVLSEWLKVLLLLFPFGSFWIGSMVLLVKKVK